MGRLYTTWYKIVRSKRATALRQADSSRSSYRVLIFSLILALMVGAAVYLGWYHFAAPQAAPV